MRGDELTTPCQATKIVDVHSSVSKPISRFALLVAELEDWVKDMMRNDAGKHRVSTYDQAGNLYSEGGLPRGYDAMGIDDYFSTFLGDPTRKLELAYYYKATGIRECEPFKDREARIINDGLSFVGGHGTYVNDKMLLDQMFQCR